MKNKKPKPKAKPSPRKPAKKRQPAVVSARIFATAPPAAAGPSREEIKPQVIAILDDVANPASRPVSDELKNLTTYHGITDTGKENLAPDFTDISRGKYGGLVVSRADSKNCQAVGDSITLVWKRANNNSR